MTEKRRVPCLDCDLAVETLVYDGVVQPARCDECAKIAASPGYKRWRMVVPADYSFARREAVRSEAALDLLDNRTDENVYCYGGPGTGKSSAIWMVGKKRLEDGKHFDYLPMADIQFSVDPAKYYRSLCGVKYLAIDNYHPYLEPPLSHLFDAIIDYRLLNKLPTALLSMHSPEAIKKAEHGLFSGRRIEKHYTILHFDGQLYRSAKGI